MKYNKQDQMLSRLAQADIIERWKHTLHTLPSNLDQMTSLFAAAGLGDSTEQKLNLENERDQKLQDIEDGLQKAQAILDLLP
jgi:hypothetical protein